MSIFRALLDGSPDMEYVLSDVKEQTDMVRLNVCCGLIGQGFKKNSQLVLNNPGGIMTIVPPQVTKGNIEFLFKVAAFLNEIFKRIGSKTAVLTHYWPPSHNNPWLKHLSLDLNCGDVRKYGENN